MFRLFWSSHSGHLVFDWLVADLQAAATVVSLSAASRHVGSTATSNYFGIMSTSFTYWVFLFNVTLVTVILDYWSIRYGIRSSRRVANCLMVAALMMTRKHCYGFRLNLHLRVHTHRSLTETSGSTYDAASYISLSAACKREQHMLWNTQHRK